MRKKDFSWPDTLGTKTLPGKFFARLNILRAFAPSVKALAGWRHQMPDGDVLTQWTSLARAIRIGSQPRDAGKLPRKTPGPARMPSGKAAVEPLVSR